MYGLFLIDFKQAIHNFFTVYFKTGEKNLFITQGCARTLCIIPY